MRARLVEIVSPKVLKHVASARQRFLARRSGPGVSFINCNKRLLPLERLERGNGERATVEKKCSELGGEWEAALKRK